MLGRGGPPRPPPKGIKNTRVLAELWDFSFRAKSEVRPKHHVLATIILNSAEIKKGKSGVATLRSGNSFTLCVVGVDASDYQV